MTRAIATMQGGALAAPMQVEEMRQQVNLIQHMMRSVMKSGEHFGTIPGCGDKPTLLKSGAEKLMMTFRMASDIDVQTTEMQNGHREVTVKVTLISPAGQRLGSGVGSCSTMEGKYRFRQEVVPGAQVPKEYWETRDSTMLGGPNRKAQKRDKAWVVVERVDHDNPADYYNTVLKMAKKRALVDAVLTTTAASDIFTQDVEDMPEVFDGAQQQQTAPEPADKEQIDQIIRMVDEREMSAEQRKALGAWLKEPQTRKSANSMIARMMDLPEAVPV